MDDIPLSLLFGILIVLILLSAFFSSAETSMMTLNRYRLRHMAKDLHRGAILVSKMLDRPDRLLGLLLFGNNLVNIFAASIVTIIAIKLFGEIGILPASLILTAVILIFGEVAPKTLAATHPERIALLFVYILLPLSYVLYPFVWLINQIANSLLALLGIKPGAEKRNLSLSSDELRTVVDEAGKLIPRRHKKMLLGILDLSNATVEDIMVSRNDIVGININATHADIVELISHCQHTRLPVYRDNIDNIIGILHVRYLPRILKNLDEFIPEELAKITREPYFVPLGTPLHTQLLNFQRKKGRIGLVVDEYGVIQGLVTLEDILEEIVGEFTTDLQLFDQDIQPQEDGSYIIKGSAMLRDINKQLDWDLPGDGPKTLNGLILHRLEDIPEVGTSLRLGDFALEITQAVDNAVKTVQIRRLSRENGTNR
ncbi:MAG: Mg2+ and Co2+ transporter CorB [Gammaproteobacteria bacterium]|nr:Mg2+ and Co2+ transporter CorB [Gammaproteobacteria bacterium]